MVRPPARWLRRAAPSLSDRPGARRTSCPGAAGAGRGAGSADTGRGAAQSSTAQLGQPPGRSAATASRPHHVAPPLPPPPRRGRGGGRREVGRGGRGRREEVGRGREVESWGREAGSEVGKAQAWGLTALGQTRTSRLALSLCDLGQITSPLWVSVFLNKVRIIMSLQCCHEDEMYLCEQST